MSPPPSTVSATQRKRSDTVGLYVGNAVLTIAMLVIFGVLIYAAAAGDTETLRIVTSVTAGAVLLVAAFAIGQIVVRARDERRAKQTVETVAAALKGG